MPIDGRFLPTIALEVKLALDHHMWYVASPSRGYQSTKEPNGLPEVLRTARNRAPAPIRGLARLFPRPTPYRRSRPPLRLLARRLSRALPQLPPRSAPQPLREPPAGTTHPTNHRAAEQVIALRKRNYS